MYDPQILSRKIPELPTLLQYLYMDQNNMVQFVQNDQLVELSMTKSGKFSVRNTQTHISKIQNLSMFQLLDIIDQLKTQKSVLETDYAINRWLEIKCLISTPITLGLAEPTVTCSRKETV